MPIPVISVAQMREWEKATWAAGRTEHGVIRRVGHIAAQKIRQLSRPGDLIVFFAGKGHNGDDARHAAQNLSDREVYLINAGDPEEAIKEFEGQLSLQPALIVDGLFGIGLNRRLSKEWASLIDRVNQSRLPILAIDVPSGMNADTGETDGSAIQAGVTLTLGAPKKGLLSSKAWKYVGRLEVAPDIGLISFPLASDLLWSVGEDFHWFPPRRRVDGHKGDFGHIGILAGSIGYHGAAVLAGRGALRARPGLVTLCTTERTYLPVAGQLQMPMVHPWSSSFHWPQTCTAILIGPGLANPDLPEDLKNWARDLWINSDRAIVVDASALAWLPKGRTAGGALRVITPHPGEAGKLLGRSSAEIQEDRPAAVEALSRCFGSCWVVLKGHQTMVGRSGGPFHVNSSGNPDLAQGGSGDLLSGYIGGLLAQPHLLDDPGRLLRFAVWQHGAAADELSKAKRNWTVDELAEELGDAQP